VAGARKQLLACYAAPARRYLLGALRDPDAADELSQEFALRFLRGDFAGADPQRGRFRNFLKGVLSHLVCDYWRRRKPRQLAGDVPEPVAPEADLDREFLDGWREALMDRAWSRLYQVQCQTGKPLYDVLQLRARDSGLRSAQIAERLSGLLDKPVRADLARQMLHRARAKFTDILLEEVAQTLELPGADDLEEELLDIGLLEYCRAALERFRRKT
jgi:RNA polymerase sigma-70 factor (ECF subfamily)